VTTKQEELMPLTCNDPYPPPGSLTAPLELTLYTHTHTHTHTHTEEEEKKQHIGVSNSA